MESFVRWADLCDFASKHYAKFERFGDGLARFDFPHDGGTAPFGMRRAPLPHGSEWVIFVLKVCPASQVQPTIALFANFLMPVGALSVMEDQVVLTQKLPIAGLTAKHVQETLEAMVRERTASTQKLARSKPGSTDSQSHLVD